MKVLVAGGGGFIGGHLCRRLLEHGAEVRSVDIKPIEQWHQDHADAENLEADLRDPRACARIVDGVDRVFLLAADMGGIGYIETNRSSCMLSVLVTANVVDQAHRAGVERLFFASSACVYPVTRQSADTVVALAENDVYPAMPEDGYGWEKLFGERLLRNMYDDHGFETRVARYHNVYGPNCTWQGGREKVPAAIARKVAEAAHRGDTRVEIWGDGRQQRSFLHVDDCVDATLRLMDSDVVDPINIGSAETITVLDLLELTAAIAGIEVEPTFDLSRPQGVRGRTSDNTMIGERLGWQPGISIAEGMVPTYRWVEEQVRNPFGRSRMAHGPVRPTR